MNEIRTLRESAALTQAALAERMQLATRTIKRWECGDTTPNLAEMEMIRRICQSRK